MTLVHIKLTDILETGYQYTKNIPLALTVSGLFLYEFFNILQTGSSFSNAEWAGEGWNSSVIPFPLVADNSILLSIVKEIVLTLNSFLVPHSHSFFSFGNTDNHVIGTIQQAVQTPSGAIGETYNSGQGLSAPFGRRELYLLITNNNWPETLINSYTQIVSVAYSLYTYGAFLFLLLGFILLLAMIAPIYLSRK